jgi:hypothetical protein
MIRDYQDENNLRFFPPRDCDAGLERDGKVVQLQRWIKCWTQQTWDYDENIACGSIQTASSLLTMQMELAKKKKKSAVHSTSMYTVLLHYTTHTRQQMNTSS